VLLLEDGREALVTARVETRGGPLVAVLEVVIVCDSSSTDQQACRHVEL
jgi:hypothetical protein